MAHAVYMHSLAEVRISPEDVAFLKQWDHVRMAERHSFFKSRAYRAMRARYEAFRSDIEKVARWKFENGHA